MLHVNLRMGVPIMCAPILVATDGRRNSEGAIRTAITLATRRERAVEVVAALQPVPRYGAGVLPPFPEGYALFDAAQTEAVRQAVARQLRELGGGAESWPVTVESGAPAAVIARRAREIGAGLVIVGAGQHDPLERWLGGETGLRVLRLATMPVLIAPRGSFSLPRRALVAVDFSDFSLRAARAVLDVLDDEPHLILVHVMWEASEVKSLPSLTEWRHTYRKGAEARLGEMVDELRSIRSLGADCLVVPGDPAEDLLGIASRMNVDLIAAGTHGYGFLGRIMMGSVSTRLIRGASCAVLAVPPESPAADLAEGDQGSS